MRRLLSGSNSFADRKVSLKRANSILDKNNIEVNDNEAGIILDFLYLVARNCNGQKLYKSGRTLKRNRILGQHKSTFTFSPFPAYKSRIAGSPSCKNRTISQCTITNWLACLFAIKSETTWMRLFR